MGRPVVMDVPVHRHGAFAEQLNSVHSDVVAGVAVGIRVVRVDCVDSAQGDVAPSELTFPLFASLDARHAIVDACGVADACVVPVERPATDHRQRAEVDVLAPDDALLAQPSPSASAWHDLEYRG